MEDSEARSELFGGCNPQSRAWSLGFGALQSLGSVQFAQLPASLLCEYQPRKLLHLHFRSAFGHRSSKMRGEKMPAQGKGGNIVPVISFRLQPRIQLFSLSMVRAPCWHPDGQRSLRILCVLLNYKSPKIIVQRRLCL